MTGITGAPGELAGRLLDALDDAGPQLRAVVTTLLIKAVDVPDDEADLMELMVASDDAGAIIDPVAAAGAALALRDRLAVRLGVLGATHGEAEVVVAMRDYLAAQVRRWAGRAVDDADNRRRAERFLSWAEHPEQLAAAQRRGLFAGMDADDLRAMAATQLRRPVSPETALSIWSEVDTWLGRLDGHVGDPVVGVWRAAAR